MYSTSFRHLTPILIPALAATVYMGLPQTNAKAAPPPPGEGFNDGGGYITITPGSLVLTAENDFTAVNPSYGWGLGGGYMFAPGSVFKGTIGVALEHNVLMLDGYKFRDFGAHMLRLVPELRLGLGGDAVWFYGLVGVGVSGMLWSWDSPVNFFDNPNGKGAAAGLDLQAGVGMQGLVYKTFFIGGEIDFDAGLFHEKDRGDWGNNDDSSFSTYQVAIEFTIGWHF